MLNQILFSIFSVVAFVTGFNWFTLYRTNCIAHRFFFTQVCFVQNRSVTPHYSALHYLNLVGYVIYGARFIYIVFFALADVQANAHYLEWDIFGQLFALFTNRNDHYWGCLSIGMLMFGFPVEWCVYLGDGLVWSMLEQLIVVNRNIANEILEKHPELNLDHPKFPQLLRKKKLAGRFESLSVNLRIQILNRMEKIDTISKIAIAFINFMLCLFATYYLFLFSGSNISKWLLPLALLDIAIYSQLMVRITGIGLFLVWTCCIVSTLVCVHIGHANQIIRNMLYGKLNGCNYRLNFFLREHCNISELILFANKRLCSRIAFITLCVNVPVAAYLLYRITQLDGQTSIPNCVQPILMLSFQVWAIISACFPLAKMTAVMHQCGRNTIPELQTLIPGKYINTKLKYQSLYERVNVQDENRYGVSFGPNSPITYFMIVQILYAFAVIFLQTYQFLH